MQKLAKRLSVVMALLMTLSILTSFGPVAKAATLYPQVQYAQEPQLEYTVGDRVSFNLYTPNYGGRVQYRVVLWNDETKSYKDLWNTPDRYYDKWMPYGNNIFTLGWVINEPGHYRITIYAKRAGITNNDCYLKGFNCDSYMESDSFVVKAKPAVETPKTPDVPAESLALTAKSVQMIVGQEYTATANVKKAGVKVIFLIDAPADSLNKDMIGEAVSDANGVATFKYTRTYADAEYVTAFSAAAPTVRDAQKVYWGVKPILTISAMDEADAASILNGGVKQYKVKLVNPLTGEPMKYKEIKVMLKENIDTPSADLKSVATVTNDFNGTRVTPYQRVNNIVPGGLNEVTLSLVTNDNGEATFTLTGYNTKATPVVFVDNYQFFNELQAVQLFKFEYVNQIPAPITLPDTSQYAPTFAGDYDNRLDATELQAAVKTVSFDLTQYTFESTMDGTKYVSVDKDFETGRTYTVTVKKPDGKPFAGGKVIVRLEELFDNNLGNDCDARIIKKVDGDDDGTKDEIELVKAIELSLDSSGKAKFTVASDTLNDIATPRVWVDQDTKDRDYARDGIFETSEPTKLLDTIYFVNEAVEAGGIDVSIDDEELEVKADADGNVVNLGGYVTDYSFTITDQNGNEWIPDKSEVLLTYTLTNDGSEDIYVMVPDLDEVKVGRRDMDEEYTLEPDETITISGIDYDEESMIQAYNDEGASGRLSVKVHAVVTKSHDQEWIWSQPTNTVGAVVADGSAVSSWHEWETYMDYTNDGDVPLKGEVVALDKDTENEGDAIGEDYEQYFVFDLDNDKDTWVLVPHYNKYPEPQNKETTPSALAVGDKAIASAYLLTYPADRDAWHVSDYVEFNRMITLGDSVYYVYDTNIDDLLKHGFEDYIFEDEWVHETDTDCFDVALYRLYNSDNSNDRPEIDDYSLEVTTPDNSSWTLSDDFDFVVFDDEEVASETYKLTYTVLDQNGDAIGSDDNYKVVFEAPGETKKRPLSEDVKSATANLSVELLDEGINEIKAYLVDSDGEKVSGTTRTIKVLKTDVTFDVDDWEVVIGEIVGFDTTGRLVIETGKEYAFIDITANLYDGRIVDGKTVKSTTAFVDSLNIGDDVKVDLDDQETVFIRDFEIDNN